MRKALFGGALLALLALLVVSPAWASNPGVCSGEKVDFEDLPATIDGVTITVVDDETVHFDIPEGSTVEVCVKAGSAKQGDGPEYYTLTEDGNLSHSSGKDISHVSVISVVTESPSPSPTGDTGPTGPTGDTGPSPSPTIRGGGLAKCEGHGQDRPKCQTATKTAPAPLAFTGPSSGMIVLLGGLALGAAAIGTFLLRLSRKHG